ncbi:hypothetical protein [Labilibaculum filiforme]|uniref:TraG/VirB4 family ATPase n=1 Tax=Labilibaculum filiforme TaxID=1940526 RepID=UPI003CCB7E94
MIFLLATLIIMDIFLQKMRRLSGVRKVICFRRGLEGDINPSNNHLSEIPFKNHSEIF